MLDSRKPGFQIPLSEEIDSDSEAATPDSPPNKVFIDLRNLTFSHQLHAYEVRRNSREIADHLRDDQSIDESVKTPPVPRPRAEFAFGDIVAHENNKYEEIKISDSQHVRSMGMQNQNSDIAPSNAAMFDLSDVIEFSPRQANGLPALVQNISIPTSKMNDSRRRRPLVSSSTH